MATIKDEIDIPGRKKMQAVLLGMGALFGLSAYGAIQNGDGQTFLVSAALCAGFVFIGAKLKTKKKLVAKGGVYR